MSDEMDRLRQDEVAYLLRIAEALESIARVVDLDRQHAYDPATGQRKRLADG